MMMTVRAPAVAGLFYPADAAELRADIVRYLADAQTGPQPQAAPKALIVPHAGYMYSGPVAARAYAMVAPLKGTIERVILLAPAHRVAFRGMALPAVDGFETPLGTVELDETAIDVLRCMAGVGELAAAHAQEHALEVQLPFLQETIGTFRLVPLVVGDVDPKFVADALQAVWGGPETLVVVSSDLSHYLPYAQAQRMDATTIEHVSRLLPTLDHHQACGATPINGLLHVARQRRLTARAIEVRNSGDTAGNRDRVVGYGSVAFFEVRNAPEPGDGESVHRSRGEALLALARAAIAREFGLAIVVPAGGAWLDEHRACFVTLRQEGVLRGCIGSITAERTLRADIAHNARAAAFSDPRFSPLAAHELAHTRIEVSLLSAPAPMTVTDEPDLLAQLRPGVDGLILAHGRHRATFLPQVWTSLPEPEAFVAQLKMKAGLGERFWHPEMRFERYAVASWRDG